MNRYPRTLFAIASSLVLLCSCGDDKTGKYEEKDKAAADKKVSDKKKFVDNPAATKFESDWSTNNVVVYHWRAEPDNMHPTNGQANPRRVIMDMTQHFIMGSDLENLSLRPDLVKALPEVSANELEYTYELREEPRWDDGSPLTMDDIIFSLKAAKCPLTNNPQAKDYLKEMQTLRTDPSNPRKFTLVMKRKYIQNVAFLTDVVIMQRTYFDPGNVLSKYTFEQFDSPTFANEKHADLQAWAENFNDPKYGRNLQFLRGLGAYEITAWEEKDRIELTRKKNHWSSKLSNPSIYEASYPEKIIFKIIQDDNAIALEMKKQTLDASTWISTTGLIDLQKDANFNRNYNSEFVDNFNYQYMGMNMKPQAVNRKPLFTDKRVRRAMALLTPVDQIIQSFYKGKATRMTSLISPLKESYNTDLKPLPLDVAGASKLLDEAGWTDTDGDKIRDKMIDGKKVSFEFELMYISGQQVAENIAKAIAESMYKAGVKANIRGIEFVAFYERVKTHEFDIYMGAWAGNFFTDDPQQIWASTNWANKGSNYVGFGTPESDRMIDSIRNSPNDSIRIPIEKRLQAYVYDEQPYVFLYVPPTKIAIHRRFDNGDMYFEKPGLLLSNLRLLQGAGSSAKPSM